MKTSSRHGLVFLTLIATACSPSQKMDEGRGELGPGETALDESPVGEVEDEVSAVDDLLSDAEGTLDPIDDMESSRMNEPAEFEGEPAEFKGDKVYVDSVIVPRNVMAGEKVQVTLKINLPNPQWRYQGCSAHHESEGGHHRLVLKPRALPPDPGTISAQVLISMDDQVEVAFEDIGACDVIVETRTEDKTARVEVLSKNVLVLVHQSGGIAGLDRYSLINSNGKCWRWSGGDKKRVEGEVEDAKITALKEATSKLSPISETRLGQGNDLMVSTITWIVEGKLVTSVRDDTTISSAERELVSLATVIWE